MCTRWSDGYTWMKNIFTHHQKRFYPLINFIRAWTICSLPFTSIILSKARIFYRFLHTLLIHWTKFCLCFVFSVHYIRTMQFAAGKLLGKLNNQDENSHKMVLNEKNTCVWIKLFVFGLLKKWHVVFCSNFSWILVCFFVCLCYIKCLLLMNIVCCHLPVTGWLVLSFSGFPLFWLDGYLALMYVMLVAATINNCDDTALIQIFLH